MHDEPLKLAKEPSTSFLAHSLTSLFLDITLYTTCTLTQQITARNWAERIHCATGNLQSGDLLQLVNINLTTLPFHVLHRPPHLGFFRGLTGVSGLATIFTFFLAYDWRSGLPSLALYCSFHEPCKVETVNAKMVTQSANLCMLPFKSISITESSNQSP